MEGSSLKQQLRAEFRQRRRSLDPTSRREFERKIHQTLVNLAENTGVGSLAAYLSFDGEVDLRPALQQLSNQGVIVTVPVIAGPPGAKSLEFNPWNKATRVLKNAFGIEEPDRERRYRLDEIDLILLPLVAWDVKGRRLGMGAGYYDRALEPVRDATKPLRVGIAFETQKAHELPQDPWDIPLHSVITENGLFTCVA